MIGRFSTISVITFLALLASALYLLKYEVQDIQNQNAAMQHLVEEERMALHLLQAEWVYLNRPDRLRALAEKHLPLGSMSPRHVVRWEALPLKAQPLETSYTPQEEAR